MRHVSELALGLVSIYLLWQYCLYFSNDEKQLNDEN